MKVKELIEILRHLNQEAVVKVSIQEDYPEDDRYLEEIYGAQSGDALDRNAVVLYFL